MTWVLIMSDYEIKPDRGTLFVNYRKEKDSQPDYTGRHVTPDGKMRRIAAWVNKSKSGTEYLSLVFQDFEEDLAEKAS